MTAPRRWLEGGLVTPAQARAIEGMIGKVEPDPQTLEGLVGAGVVTRSQVGAILRTQRANGHAMVAYEWARASPTAPQLLSPELGVKLPRLSLDATKLGVFLAAVAFVGLVWAAVALLADAFDTPRRPFGIGMLDSLRLLAGVVGLVGARRMYRGVGNGKPLALTGLVLYALASVLLVVRRLGDPVVMALLIGFAVLYYLTAASRFRPVRPPRAGADPN